MRHLSILAFLVALSLSGQPATTRGVALDFGSSGSVRFTVPFDWGSRPSDLRTLVLQTRERSVELRITPLRDARQKARAYSDEEIRAWLTDAAAAVEPTAVEKPLLVQKLGAVGGGWYFSATDRAPKPGEFEFLSQGVFAAGPVLVTFTVLSHEAPPKGMAGALAIVRSARFSPAVK
jgi:hypothetical protein